MTSPLRLGIVPYVNVLPLLEGLDAHFPRSNWVHATPRELSGLLASGEIDVAMLPVFEALRTPGYRMIPGCAIACDGSVRSVGMYSRVPLEEVRRVLLDRGSLTSVHLARILAGALLRIDPEWVLSDAPLEPEADFAAAGFDAAVAIGDTALAWEGRFAHALDFGEAWKQLTGLPFVFAAWVAREGAEVSTEDIAAFRAAREVGERRAREIAERLASGDPARAASLTDYLTRAIRFRLGKEQLAAIELFRRKLIAHGLLGGETPGMVVLGEGRATARRE